MKPISFALTYAICIVLLLCNCQNGIEDMSDFKEPGKAMLAFRISPYQKITFENASTSSSTDFSSAFKTVMLAVYKDEKLDTLINQQANDLDFGNISLKLPYDNYRFVFLAHSSAKQPSMDNPKRIDFGSSNMSDVLFWSDSLRIEKDTAINVKLNRVVAKVEINTTDNQTKDDANAYIRFTGGSNVFDATLGKASFDFNDYYIIKLNADNIGKPISVSFYTFPTSEEKLKEVLFYTYNKIGIINDSKTINDVPIKPNYIIRLTGKLHK